MNIKKVISVDIEEKFVNMIIKYAEENNMTINNIRECIKKVEQYMQGNAILEKRDLE